VKDRTVPLKATAGKVRLTMLVDRLSLEIFGNEGAVYLPMALPLDAQEKALRLATEGAEAKITSLEVHELRSIWNQ
jgi:sucrose-6-phosphate hydrolase SacC (GH32 family)